MEDASVPSGGITAHRLLLQLRRGARCGAHAKVIAQKFRGRVGQTLPDRDAYDLLLLCVRSTEIERPLARRAQLKSDAAVSAFRTVPRERAARIVAPLASSRGDRMVRTMIEPGDYC